MATPLIPLRDLGREYGAKHLYAKLEYAFPAANHKFRMASAAVAHAAGGRWQGISAASCGHLAASLAYICSRRGISCRLFVPRGCPIEITASQWVSLDASSAFYEEAVRRSIACAETEHLLEATPGSRLTAEYREALSSIAVEILAQSRIPPEVVICPVGNGTTLAGIHNGFLCHASEIPVHFGVSSNNALTGPTGDVRLIDWDVEPLRSSEPLDAAHAQAAVRDSGGQFVSVSVEEIREARDQLYSQEGLAVHPAAAAALAGWKRLILLDRCLLSKQTILILTAAPHPPYATRTSS